jgi:hypothetical protein
VPVAAVVSVELSSFSEAEFSELSFAPQEAAKSAKAQTNMTNDRFTLDFPLSACAVNTVLVAELFWTYKELIHFKCSSSDTVSGLCLPREPEGDARHPERLTQNLDFCCEYRYQSPADSGRVLSAKDIIGVQQPPSS